MTKRELKKIAERHNWASIDYADGQVIYNLKPKANADDGNWRVATPEQVAEGLLKGQVTVTLVDRRALKKSAKK